MTVYVDSMRAHYGRMVMCHMIADTTTELVEMADRIGVARRWIQNAGTHKEHFDVSLGCRALAVKHGAQEVTMMQLGRIIRAKKAAATPVGDA
jgi:hypothetical protein